MSISDPAQFSLVVKVGVGVGILHNLPCARHELGTQWYLRNLAERQIVSRERGVTIDDVLANKT